MTYIPTLEQVQLGLEGAYGTGSVATILLAGIDNFRIDPRVDSAQLSDKRGDTMMAHDAYITKRWSEGVIEGVLNYEQAYIYLDAMFGEVAPTGTPDVREYFGSLDWDPEVEQSLCLYYGQTGGIFRANGCLPSELVLAGASGEPVRFSMPFFGRAATDGNSFASIAEPDVTYVMGSHCELYLDDGIDADPGTTPLADTAFRFEFRIDPNRKPVWHLGDVEPDSWRNGKWAGSCRLTIEATATTLGYLGDILDATVSPRGYAVQIRMTDGTEILDVKFTGHAVVPPNLIPDDDGVVVIELALLPAYGSHVSFEASWGAVLTLS